MHPHTVAIDVESVRSQLSNELGRAVSDSELVLWLRRCGHVEHNGKWISSVTQSAPYGVALLNAPAFASRLNRF